MARINKYQLDEEVNDKDLLVGTDRYDFNKTKNYKLETLKDYFQDGAVKQNLSYVASPTQGEVQITEGTDAVIPLVNNTNAGLASPQDKAKIESSFDNTIVSSVLTKGDTYTIELNQQDGGVVPIEFTQSHRHIQSSNSNEWIITHNLGYRPSVTIIDLDGNVVNGDITYNTNNQLTLTFAQPIKGEAYLN